MAAKSLVCQQCNKFLRNVAEAQSHGELTGHSQFAESVEAIKTVVCTACGKPCRTDAERELHTRYTQHIDFVDKTDETPTLNTESEMKDARAEQAADDDLVRIALGKKPKAAAASTSGDPAEMVPAVVDEALLKELEAMGFATGRATRGIHFSDSVGVEAAVNWIMEHDADMDVDEPLLVPKGQPPRVALSVEEQLKKAEDLVRRAKVRRENDERASLREREKDRVRTGKELQAAKAKESELDVKRNVDARKREKEDEARARARIKDKLEEDRRDRRRKMGLPEELTEEEKAKEVAKVEADKKKAEDRKKNFIVIKPNTAIDKLRTVLVGAKKASPGQDEAFKGACQVLLKYLGNVVGNPDEDKFRTIKLTNAAFMSRVAPFGGREFLELCGFQASGEVLVLSREAVNMELLNAAGNELNGALNNPYFGML